MTEQADPSALATIDQVIARARAVLDPGRFAWAAAGAGQGVTKSRNSLALNQLALVPRVMRNVENVDISSSFLGVPLAMPVLLAPVGALELYDEGDGVAAARAAAEMSTAAMISTHGTSPWAEAAATAPGRHFFQLYVFGDRAWTADVLDYVAESGFAGVCVTVDTPVIARRDASIETGFVWRQASDITPDLARHGSDESHRTRYSSADLEWLAGRTQLPVIVKGIMSPEDAAAAVAAGAAAIYVSNHGGRVVDHSLSTIEVLGEVVETVGDDIEVVVDSGFTRGAEVVKALALGARAVGIGRLQCWGLAVGGTAGVKRVLEILSDEIAITMANIGCPSVADIGKSHVRWSLAAPPSRRLDD